MSQAGTIAWFAGHESRLTWRDWLSMATAGGRWRKRTVTLWFIAFVIGMHAFASAMVGRFAVIGLDPDKATLIAISGCILLSWTLLVSQAIESVTRAFYARSDLDLILTSPVAIRKLFVVRIITLAFSITAMALMLTAPFINVLVLRGGARWLAAYGVVVAMGATAASLALVLTIALFRTIGPKRTRLIAQIVAAVVGASFVIGLQVAAILSTNSLSRYSFLGTDIVMAFAPEAGSLLWLPARAVVGDLGALAVVVAASLIFMAGATFAFSKRFGQHVIAASGVSVTDHRDAARAHEFRALSPKQMLRLKEWVLLRRDPWLLSQSLMQLLYLLPPALLLWRNFGDDDGALVLLVPVLVMAAGQLAGGLAWITISGEDAPDLVATAPVTPQQIVRAKIEAVIGAIAVVFAPFVLWLMLASPLLAIVAAAGILIAAGSATAIQLWFRAQAKRSHFRRRQTSSRLATFAEAFSSIIWAATAGLAAMGTWIAALTAIIAILVLAGARQMRPRAGA
jgi:ABC-2 type transport system permease protein